MFNGGSGFFNKSVPDRFSIQPPQFPPAPPQHFTPGPPQHFLTSGPPRWEPKPEPPVRRNFFLPIKFETHRSAFSDVFWPSDVK